MMMFNIFPSVSRLFFFFQKEPFKYLKNTQPPYADRDSTPFDVRIAFVIRFSISLFSIFTFSVNHLKPSDYYMYHQVSH